MEEELEASKGRERETTAKLNDTEGRLEVGGWVGGWWSRAVGAAAAV